MGEDYSLEKTKKTRSFGGCPTNRLEVAVICLRWMYIWVMMIDTTYFELHDSTIFNGHVLFFYHRQKMASMVCSLPKLVLPVGAYRPHRGVSLSAGELMDKF